MGNVTTIVPALANCKHQIVTRVVLGQLTQEEIHIVM
jgi:hypothetical protein